MLDLLAAHFLFAAFTALFTIIPPYVLDRGGEEWQIGIVVGSFGVVGLVVRPFAGRWINLLGAKRVAVAGSAVFALSSVLYLAAVNVWLLIPVRMLQGIGLAMAPVATSTIVANLAPAHRRGEAMAYMGNAIAVASLYAPVIGFSLLSEFGFASSFLFAAAMATLGALAAMGISPARIDVPVSGEAAGRVPLISRPAIFPTVIMISYTINMAPVSTFLPLLAEDRGLGNPGLFFTVNSLTTIFALMVSGAVADRLGRSAVIVPGLLSSAASMLLLTVAGNRPTFLGAAFMSGAGFGLLQPGVQSLTVDRVAPRERSSAMATLQSAWDIGGSGAAFALGPVAALTSVAATFGMAGVGNLLGVTGLLVGRARPGGRPPVQAERSAH